MTPIEYKGYTIEKELEPWAIKYGMNYKFYHDEVVHSAATIEECKEQIDELVEIESV